MSSSSSSAIFSKALSALSETTHKLIADVEGQSRAEVASALAEANQARHQRDQALQDLRATEAAAKESKAAHAQAELTVTHHLDTIAQLRREINQWKDQSKNWQDHFLRVEQERCALSSRVDELVAERLVWARTFASEGHTPRARHTEPNGIITTNNHHPDKHENIASPPLSASSRAAKAKATANADTTSQHHHNAFASSSTTKSSKKTTNTTKWKHAHTELPAPLKSLVQQQVAGPSQSTSSTATSTSASSSAPASPLDATHGARAINTARPTIRQSTVVRRVQATVRVKREDDSGDDQPPLLATPAAEPHGQTPAYPDIRDHHSRSQKPPQQRQCSESKSKRRQSRMIVEDEDEESEDDNETVARNLRTVRSINYAESDDGSNQNDDVYESEEDELMIGTTEMNQDEAFGASKTPRKHKSQKGGPPSKKRRVGTPRPMR